MLSVFPRSALLANKADQNFGGDWTERKLEALQKYLSAYVTALSDKGFELEYIDAFAGTGYRELPEFREEGTGHLFPDLIADGPQRYLDGSAAKALQTKRPFDAYRFVELSDAKAVELNKLRSRFPTLAGRIDVIRDDANSYLLRRASEDWIRAHKRAVVFVDPFGMQVDWTTIAALSNTKAVDLWLLYPVSAINRLLSAEGVRFKAWEKRLNRVFGDEGWREACYRTKAERDLFDGLQDKRIKTANLDSLTDYMVKKLKGVFVEVVEHPLVLRNNNGTPLFALCFAAANPQGAAIAVRIAKHIVEH